MNTLRGIVIVLLTVLALTACGEGDRATDTLNSRPTAESPTLMPSPSKTSVPEIVASPSSTVTPPTAVLQACSQLSDVDLSDLSLAFTTEWDGDLNIYVIGGDGSGLQQFTQTKKDERAPKYSPDGQWLAYLVGPISSGPGTKTDMRLFITPTGGGSEIPMASEYRVVAVDISWSPDGRWISFPTAEGLGVVEVETGKAHQLSFAHLLGFHSTSWSPGSDKIVFTTVISPTIAFWTMHLAQRDGEYLGEYNIDYGDIRSVDWHPVEDKILVTSIIKGEGIDLYVISEDGASVERLTSTGKKEGYGKGDSKWSLDGAMIAYETLDEIQPDPEVADWVPHHSLRAMNADGSSDQEVVAAPKGIGQAIDEFEWAPYGRHIAYISTGFIEGERGISNLHIVNVCTGEDILIAEDVSESTYTWWPLP
ncbi:MAG: hypothetical protein GTO14_25245 [Anaerolineales bacterium]|nr:hypothetical protein [Anaerolineales bacterium]